LDLSKTVTVAMAGALPWFSSDRNRPGK
jgi:hypothetical protein